MKIKKLKNRLYNDYFMKNRYAEYELLIKELLDNNYHFIMVRECEKLSTKGKHIIIRHDIDSDVKIARKMFEIEKKYGVKSTFYFRKCTFDNSLMKEINEYGSEVGYHFEEIATYVKKNKLKNRDEIINNMDSIQKEFVQNIESFEEKFNIKITSIAAHGDFINRKYNIANNYLFDKKMRKKYPNIIEAYDSVVEEHLDSRISDEMYPSYWKPENPFNEIKKGKKNMLILVHTRWWDKAPFERLKCELLRIIEDIKY